MLGTNTRASYTPTDASDYNAALDQADRTCVVVGGAMVVGGTDAAAGGVIAAPETAGTSLVVSAVGLGVAAEGTYMAGNATRNLLNGNHYGEDDDWETEYNNENKRQEEALSKKNKGQTKENTKGYEKETGEQFEGITKAKDNAGKSSPAGQKQNQIQSTQKSKQIDQKELNEYKKR